MIVELKDVGNLQLATFLNDLFTEMKPVITAERFCEDVGMALAMNGINKRPFYDGWAIRLSD